MYVYPCTYIRMRLSLGLGVHFCIFYCSPDCSFPPVKAIPSHSISLLLPIKPYNNNNTHLGRYYILPPATGRTQLLGMWMQLSFLYRRRTEAAAVLPAHSYFHGYNSCDAKCAIVEKKKVSIRAFKAFIV